MEAGGYPANGLGAVRAETTELKRRADQHDSELQRIWDRHDATSEKLGEHGEKLVRIEGKQDGLKETIAGKGGLREEIVEIRDSQKSQGKAVWALLVALLITSGALIANLLAGKIG